MWQRQQTLYLAISTILMVVMIFSVKAVVPAADGSWAEAYKYAAYTPYLILLIIISLLDLLALTTFKVRVFQMRTAVLSALITFAFAVWLLVDFIQNHGSMVFRYTAVFPVLSIILNIMAVRGILADQLLVESAYHLRKSRRERRAEEKKLKK